MATFRSFSATLIRIRALCDADWPDQPAVDAVIALGPLQRAPAALVGAPDASGSVPAARAYAAAIDRAVASVVAAKAELAPPEEQAKQLGSLIAEGQAILQRYHVASLSELENALKRLSSVEGRSAAADLRRATATWRSELAAIEASMAPQDSAPTTTRQLRAGDQCPPFEAVAVCPELSGAAPVTLSNADALTSGGTRPAVLVFLRHFG
jgi:hypothetical protein